jgi:5-methylcytosine-specific restriction endonuclease McrA
VCDDRREAHADHVVPIAAGGERYDLANGQTLCVKCHGAKTAAENRQKGTARTA